MILVLDLRDILFRYVIITVRRHCSTFSGRRHVEIVSCCWVVLPTVVHQTGWSTVAVRVVVTSRRRRTVPVRSVIVLLLLLRRRRSRRRRRRRWRTMCRPLSTKKKFTEAEIRERERDSRVSGKDDRATIGS